MSFSRLPFPDSHNPRLPDAAQCGIPLQHNPWLWHPGISLERHAEIQRGHIHHWLAYEHGHSPAPLQVVVKVA